MVTCELSTFDEQTESTTTPTKQQREFMNVLFTAKQIGIDRWIDLTNHAHVIVGERPPTAVVHEEKLVVPVPASNEFL